MRSPFASGGRRRSGRGVRVAAAAAGLTLFLLAYRDELLGVALAPLAAATARVAAAMIELLGMEVASAASAVLRHPAGFACEVTYRCSGVLPAAVLSAAVAASAAPLRLKALGIAVGVPALWAVNLVRLVHLFHIGVYAPERFELAHGVLWEGALMAAALGLFTIWQAGARARLFARGEAPERAASAVR